MAAVFGNGRRTGRGAPGEALSARFDADRITLGAPDRARQTRRARRYGQDATWSVFAAATGAKRRTADAGPLGMAPRPGLPAPDRSEGPPPRSSSPHPRMLRPAQALLQTSWSTR